MEKSYYKKDNHKNKYYRKNNKVVSKKEIQIDKEDNKNEKKKVTYDSLMHTSIPDNTKKEVEYDKIIVIRSIAISVVVFAIIVCSLILFSQM